MRALFIRSAILLSVSLASVAPACAWGDEGHRIVGRIALPLLTAQARAQVNALLAADTDTLTAPDFVGRTTCADRWRDSDRNATKIRYTATEQWHFVDIELASPDLSDACVGQAPLPPSTVASAGPARDCVVDKVVQFSGELADPSLPETEHILALKFLLHFAGDLHQPLHAADNHDRGGNDVAVLFGNRHVASKLHAYWDTVVVQHVGRDEAGVADDLSVAFADRRAAWSQGSPAEWAQESFAAAREVAYALPARTQPDEHGKPAYRLDAAYEQRAQASAREQLAKAGVRLAALLNAALR